jgi:hypothetical protein
MALLIFYYAWLDDRVYWSLFVLKVLLASILIWPRLILFRLLGYQSLLYLRFYSINGILFHNLISIGTSSFRLRHLVYPRLLLLTSRDGQSGLLNKTSQLLHLIQLISQIHICLRETVLYPLI